MPFQCKVKPNHLIMSSGGPVFLYVCAGLVLARSVVCFHAKKKLRRNTFVTPQFLYVSVRLSNSFLLCSDLLFPLISIASENSEQVEEQVDEVQVKSERTKQCKFLRTLVQFVCFIQHVLYLL